MRRFFIGLSLVLSGALWAIIDIMSNMKDEIDAYEKWCLEQDRNEKEYSSEESAKIVMKHKRSVSAVLTEELEFFNN